MASDELILLPDLVQGSPAWHAIRREKRTASTTPCVMDTSSWAGPADAYDNIVEGKLIPDNPALRHGRRTEGRARSALEMHLGIEGDPLVGYRGDWLASLDFLGDAGALVVEVKCPYAGVKSKTWQAAARGEIEPGYADQIEHQFNVFRPERAGLWVYIDDDTKIWVPYDPRPQRWGEIQREWERFYNEHILKKVRPSQYTERKDVEFLTEAETYAKLKATIDQLEKNLETSGKRLKEMAGTNRVVGGGVRVNRFFKSGLVDKDEVIREFAPADIDLEDYRKVGKYEQRIDIVEEVK